MDALTKAEYQLAVTVHPGANAFFTYPLMLNRTMIFGDDDIDAFGCGLRHTSAQAPKAKQFGIWINLTTPYMLITSDGKAPDLREQAVADRRGARQPYGLAQKWLWHRLNLKS